MARVRAPLARVKRNFARVMSDVFAISRGKTITAPPQRS